MGKAKPKGSWKLIYLDYDNGRLVHGSRYHSIEEAIQAVLNAGKVVSKKPKYPSETAWIVEIDYPTGEHLTFLIDMFAV